MDLAGETAQGLGILRATKVEMTDDKQPGETVSEKAEDPMRHPLVPPGAQKTANIVTTSLPRTASKSPANPFSDGDEAKPLFQAADTTQSRLQEDDTSQAPEVPQLGSLHKRRASTSPQKFNAGKFEPLPLHIGQAADQEPPKKRARIENKVEITYDPSGTPRIASITPTIAFPSGRSISATYLLNHPKLTPFLSKTPTSATEDKGFNLLEAFCKHNDLLLLLVSYLSIPSLISFYSISKAFHVIFNRDPTAYILSCMRTWAPKADEIYPWRCYQSLCIKDPTNKHKSRWDSSTKPKTDKVTLRDTPSLRWLQMVIWREGITKDILIQLATKGLRCQKGTQDTIKRLWFIMDLPLNAHRIALCRSEDYISESVVTLATAFFLKVDMRFTDPAGPIYPPIIQGQQQAKYPPQWQMGGFVGCDLRELLTAERSMTPLWRVLRGMSWDMNEPNVEMNRLDVLRLWVRHKYRLPADVPEQAKKHSIMGIPWYEVGTAGLERTSVSIFNVAGKDHVVVDPGLLNVKNPPRADQQILYPHRKRIAVPTTKPREPLLRPDELMMREGIRRQLGLHKKWTSMMLWGFSDDLGRVLALRTEEELLTWSKGKKPLHPFKTDKQVLEEREAAKQGKMAAEKGASGNDVEGSGKVETPVPTPGMGGSVATV